MMRCPSNRSELESAWRCSRVTKSYSLIQTFRSTETCRPRANDQDVNFTAIEASVNVVSLEVEGELPHTYPPWSQFYRLFEEILLYYVADNSKEIEPFV